MHKPLLSLCAALAVPAFGATITNPSFETGTPVFATPLVTDWRLDGHAFVTAQSGITPAAGNRMLKFLSTSFASPSAALGTWATSSDVHQIVSMTSLADQALITSGSGSVTLAALFNRVAGPAPSPVDTQFGITLASYSSYANAQALVPTNTFSTFFLSDSILTTWESLSCSLALPTSTQYISVRLMALENVVNDPGFPEFHGHYADSVALKLVPSPGAVALASLGGLLVCRRRRD